MEYRNPRRQSEKADSQLLVLRAHSTPVVKSTQTTAGRCRVWPGFQVPFSSPAKASCGCINHTTGCSYGGIRGWTLQDLVHVWGVLFLFWEQWEAKKQMDGFLFARIPLAVEGLWKNISNLENFTVNKLFPPFLVNQAFSETKLQK